MIFLSEGALRAPIFKQNVVFYGGFGPGLHVGNVKSIGGLGPREHDHLYKASIGPNRGKLVLVAVKPGDLPSKLDSTNKPPLRIPQAHPSICPARQYPRRLCAVQGRDHCHTTHLTSVVPLPAFISRAHLPANDSPGAESNNNSEGIKCETLGVSIFDGQFSHWNLTSVPGECIQKLHTWQFLSSFCLMNRSYQVLSHHTVSQRSTRCQLLRIPGVLQFAILQLPNNHRALAGAICS
mmetsp:Transcript_28077/g.34068  ORF Transcript_28077/g.34068 Transcript_28077/m.34068 type:complete len:237 (-) Transcript_28077:377-1087(-)